MSEKEQIRVLGQPANVDMKAWMPVEGHTAVAEEAQQTARPPEFSGGRFYVLKK